VPRSRPGCDDRSLTCWFVLCSGVMWSLRTWSWKPSGVVSRFVRRVRTASGAVAVQVVTRRGRQVERVEHVGSAHTDAELALLLAAARERLSPGQDVLDLGDLPVVPARMDDVADWTAQPTLPLEPATPMPGGRPPAVAAGGRVVGTSAEVLWKVLTSAYARLGFDVLGDDGFRAMVLARIVEPTAKAEVVRVLEEIGAPAVGLRTLFRSLARCQARDYRGQLATAAWAHSVRASGKSVKPRVWWRVGSHAPTVAGASILAAAPAAVACAVSCSTGGIRPSWPCRRRWLYQSMYSAVAISTSSIPRHGPWWRISSALYSELNASAIALS